jgi:hypothetical protein
MSVKGGPNTVTSGLVLELDAGNIKSYQSGSITWFDKSGFANNGTLINGPTFNTGSGGSIVFDGADDYMKVTPLTGSNFPQATGTISFWYYIATTGGNTDFSDKAIFDGFDTNNRNHFFVRNYYEPPNNIQIVAQSSASGAYRFAYNDYLPNDQWHNVVLSYTTGSNSSYQIYLDGTLRNSGTLGSNPSTFVPDGQFCGFGSGYLGGGVFACMQGRYSALQIYNRALTAQEVLQNYNATKTRFGL